MRTLRPQSLCGELAGFFREHIKSIRRSGAFALSDIFIYTFPYYVVPWAFGLGAPTIILEATFPYLPRRERHLYRSLRSRHSRSNPGRWPRTTPHGLFEQRFLRRRYAVCQPRSSACC